MMLLDGPFAITTMGAVLNVAQKMIRREKVLTGATYQLVACDAVYWVTNAQISDRSPEWDEDADLRAIRRECERMVKEEGARRRAGKRMESFPLSQAQMGALS